MAVWVRATSLGERVGELQASAAGIAALVDRPQGADVLATRCAVLLVGVQADNGDLPSPDRAVTRLLGRAYTAYAKAGLACASEAKSGQGSPSEAVRAGLASGGVEVLKALSRAELISGRAIPTSTTTPPSG